MELALILRCLPADVLALDPVELATIIDVLEEADAA